MKNKLVAESIEGFFRKTKQQIKQMVFDKFEKISNIIRSKNFKKASLFFGNEENLNKVRRDFIKLAQLFKIKSDEDIYLLDDMQLLTLNNNLNNILDDYDLQKRTYESLTEAYEPKDLKRVKDFAKKSGGNFEKEVALARQMANTLSNVNKAIGRAEAAAEVYGEWNDIVQIFYDKAKELGYEGPVPGKRLEVGIVLGSKFVKEKQYKNKIRERYRSPRGGNPVLPLGKVDLRTGKCEHFNVYDTWNNEGTVEVWRDNKGMNTSHLDVSNQKVASTGIASLLKPKSKEEIELKMRQYFNYKLVFTSGNTPLHEIGEKDNFVHDQNGNMIGRNWEMVDYVPLKHMRELILPYGGHLSGYCYK